ncbi:MAG: hypothetical protein JJU33_05255 [Phycisphaerales bacterium]|nr:hypothetical protein [Phycisphaerales bacterium]
MTSTPKAAPAPNPAEDTSPSAHDHICPGCSYQIATPDAANCPECGCALRLKYANGWTINSGRWLRRLTLCLLTIAVLHFAASLVWPIVELTFWSSWRNTGAHGWFTNIVVYIVDCWDNLDAYWPMFLGLLLSSALLAIVAVGSFRNLRLIRTNRDPDPGVTHRAWRTVFVMLLLVASLAAAQSVALWVQFFRF